MTRRRTESGYTMIELTLVAAFTLVFLAIVGSLVGSTQELTEDTHARTGATKEHRRNLRALAHILRSADVTTLAGFDGSGLAIVPVFQRVIGADLETRSYSDEERFEWRPATHTVPSIDRPGDVWLVRGTEAEIIARNVPLGGFDVRQEGTALAVRLTTYYTTSARKTAQVTSETAVSLRN